MADKQNIKKTKLYCFAGAYVFLCVAMMSAYKEDYAVTFVFISTSLQKKINF